MDCNQYSSYVPNALFTRGLMFFDEFVQFALERGVVSLHPLQLHLYLVDVGVRGEVCVRSHVDNAETNVRHFV